MWRVLHGLKAVQWSISYTVCGYTCCAFGVGQHQGVQFVQACLGSHQHGLRMVPALRLVLRMCAYLSLMSHVMCILARAASLHDHLDFGHLICYHIVHVLLLHGLVSKLVSFHLS